MGTALIAREAGKMKTKARDRRYTAPMEERLRYVHLIHAAKDNADLTAVCYIVSMTVYLFTDCHSANYCTG